MPAVNNGPAVTRQSNPTNAQYVFVPAASVASTAFLGAGISLVDENGAAYTWTGSAYAQGGTGAVASVNGHVGAVSLGASDVGAAPVASPTFTGTPAAPTASPNTNSTQLATTAYADAGLALKAPLASPTFTGTQTLPGLTLTGATVATANAMGGTQIDVSQPLNTVNITANTIYSIIGGHSAGRESLFRVTNATGTDWTATLPAGMNSQAQGAVVAPAVLVRAGTSVLLGIGDDGTTYSIVGDSASIFTYEGTWGSRPTTGISAGAIARMTSGVGSAVDVICKWSAANTDWVPVGPVCLFQLTSDATVTESGSGAAEAVIAGASVTLPVGLLRPGGHLDFNYVGQGALNTNNKTFRQRMFTSATISGSTQLSGQNHASAGSNGLSGGSQIEVLATNKLVTGHTNALSAFADPLAITDVTSIDNSTTAIVLFMTSQLAASAASMTLHAMRVIYTPGMN